MAAGAAAQLAAVGAQRAVGNALGRNPVAIVVPCHRVIAAGGGIGGYTGGLDIFEPALSGLFPGGFETWVVGREKVRPVKPVHLSPPARLANGSGAGKSAPPTGKGRR